MDMEPPKVVTTITKSDYNFRFRIYAYRKLSQKEALYFLREWMRQTKRTQIPRNTTIDYQTIVGAVD